MQFLYYKPDYTENVIKTVDAINTFFASGCKTKNFPTEEITSKLPTFLKTILDQFTLLEPSWINDTEKVSNAIKFIKSCVDEGTTESDDYNRALAGLKSLRVLQFISENYTEFTTLVEAMNTFILFVAPSEADKHAVEVFSTPIRLDLLDEILGVECYVLDKPLFDIELYTNETLDNEYITLNPKLNRDTEVKRICSFIKWTDPDPNDNELVEANDVVQQEAAEVNYFVDTRNPHFKYDEKSNKMKISDQYKGNVTKFISGIKKCDSTEDLVKYFTKEDDHAKDAHIYTMILDNVSPFIVNKVFNNTTKYPFDDLGSDNNSKLVNYIKSYKSIADKSGGAKRFLNYDLFTVFKVDKEGTVKFLEDFLTLNLFNDEKAVITNNKLLTLFNIFDSRIYLDILYNNIPDSAKKDDYATEDMFVKTVRGRINANSRKANMYSKGDSSEKDTDTTEAVVEYVNTALTEFGDMSITDMTYCEQFADILYKETSTIDDRIFNNGLSPIQINEYMSSCKFGLDVFIQEAETGDIPDYMKNRISLSDDNNGGNNKVNVLNYDLPDDAPLNPLGDVLNSIDAKMDMNGDIDDLIGSGYNDTQVAKKAGVVYNITNNYSNSFNKTNSTVTNDLSSNKTTTTTKTDSSVNKKTNIHEPRRNNTGKDYDNNYNNSIRANDTKVSKNAPPKDDDQVLSSGHSIQEVFAFLEAEEPLSNRPNAGDKPKGDLLTTAMDIDRKTLGAQQTAKKGVQKIVNTGKAITKPFVRTKQWMTKIIDSLIKRDEDRVKAEIIENPSYRTALYKASRFALKLGLTGVAFTISGYLGAAYLVMNGAKIADKQRLRKEVQSEFAAELEILDKKIALAEGSEKPEDRKALFQMMRLRSKMRDIVATSPKQKVKHSSSIW